MKEMNRLQLICNIISYNLKIIFANKFIYFLFSAMAFFFVVMGVMLFSEANPGVEDIYSTLIFPGILIIFYPVIFNVQNDKDARMLEIVFGIPNYRYKVYLLRFLLSIMLLFVILCVMAWIMVFAVLDIPVFSMVIELMYCLFFLSSLSFLFSTLVKSGSGAAVIMVIIGLIFLIMAEPLAQSKWNLFLNPFRVPSDMSLAVWTNVLHQNRIMLVVGSAVSLLWSLINLQRREKFV